MHYPFHACSFCSVKQNGAVSGCISVCEAYRTAIVEPDVIGIVKDRYPCQSAFQPVGPVKAQGINCHPSSEGIRAFDPHGWDWGMLGYIYVTRENVRKGYDVNLVSRDVLEKAATVLEAEVEEYDHYLTGNVYGYEITRGNRQAGEVIDSCWGFFGYPEDYLIPEAKSIIDRKEADLDRH
jgi:hypothetical protein